MAELNPFAVAQKQLDQCAKILNLAERVSTVGEWEPPPPYRYCWPVVG